MRLRLAAFVGEMTAFVMRLPFLTEENKIRLESWARLRCLPDTFMIVDELDVAGGVLKTMPRSLKHFQAAMGNNLRNWRADRQICERGWLQFVSVDELSTRLGVVAATEKRRSEYNERFHTIIIPAEAKRRQLLAKAQRDEELKVAVQKLQTIVVKRTRASFELLAEDVLASRKALAERRAAKRQAFDQERFNRPDISMRYSTDELDECSSWHEVKRRRLTTYTDWKLKEDAALERIAKQRADELLHM